MCSSVIWGWQRLSLGSVPAQFTIVFSVPKSFPQITEWHPMWHWWKSELLIFAVPATTTCVDSTILLLLMVETSKSSGRAILGSPLEFLVNSPSYLPPGGALIADHPWVYLFTASMLHCLCCFPMFTDLLPFLCCWPLLSVSQDSVLSASPWLMILLCLNVSLSSSTILMFS